MSQRRRPVRIVTCGIAVCAFALCLTALRADQGPPPPPPPASGPIARGTSTLSGVVVLGDTDQPVAGALVQVQQVRLGDNTSRLRAQLTDTSGRFVFAELPDGMPIRLLASKNGYLDAGAGFDVPEPDRRITLQHTEWRADVRLRLWRGAVISGVVRDERGEPAVDVWVRAVARAELAGHDRLISGQLTTTDDHGRYRLANLPAGRYIIEVPGASASSASQPNDPTGPPNRLQFEHFPVAPPGATRMTYPSTYFPGATGPGEASAIALAAGEERSGVDITLSPTTAVNISGRVEGLSASRQSLRVRLIPDGAEDLALGPDVAQAVVETDGRFRFTGVPPGTYTLDASRVVGAFTQDAGENLNAGFAWLLSGVNRSRDLPLASHQARFSSSAVDAAERLMIAREPLAVGSRDVTGEVLTMEPAGTMSGVVRQRLVPGVPTPEVAPTVGIFCDPADGSPMLGSPIQELDPSQAGESFAMNGLRPGRYFIRVSHGWTVERISWNGQDYTDRPFDAGMTRDFAGIEVVVTNAGASLTGVVRDSSGLPASGGTVLVMPDQAALRKDFGLWPTRFRVVAIAAGGRFATSDLPAGTYRVVALPPTVAVRLAPWFLESVASTGTPVSLTASQQQNVNLVLQEARR